MYCLTRKQLYLVATIPKGLLGLKLLIPKIRPCTVMYSGGAVCVLRPSKLWPREIKRNYKTAKVAENIQVSSKKLKRNLICSVKPNQSTDIDRKKKKNSFFLRDIV